MLQGKLVLLKILSINFAPVPGAMTEQVVKRSLPSLLQQL
jgi:hypothetical protein